MARLNAQQAASFPTGGGRNSFLSLQNDGDSAVVRFAYNSVDELCGCDSVHTIKNTETDKYVTVDCLKTDNSNPDSVCPLCASGIKMQKIYYLQVRHEETGEMLLWQRSENFVLNTLVPLLSDYEADGTPITGLPIKIVRHGAKGDLNTTYALIPKAADGMTLDQFPEDIDVRVEGIVKEYSFQELQNYVATGKLPTAGNNQEESAIRPRGNAPVNMGQPARVEDYSQAPVQAPATRSRRTINQGGY
jgi:hypothetical protein